MKWPIFTKSNILYITKDFLYSNGRHFYSKIFNGLRTGAVHLSNRNAGVPRWAQSGQTPGVEQKGKSSRDFDFQYEYRQWKRGLSIPLINRYSEFEARGVRKVTTGITGLWRPSVHSDVALLDRESDYQRNPSDYLKGHFIKSFFNLFHSPCHLLHVFEQNSISVRYK